MCCCCFRSNRLPVQARMVQFIDHDCKNSSWELFCSLEGGACFVKCRMRQRRRRRTLPPPKLGVGAKTETNIRLLADSNRWWNCGEMMRNKLLTSLKRREKETTEKERHSSGELPSFVAHSLVPSDTIPVCPSPDCQINTAPALSIDLDTIRSIRLSLKDKTHLTAMKTISISSWNRLSVVDLNWRFKLWLEISSNLIGLHFHFRINLGLHIQASIQS